MSPDIIILSLIYLGVTIANGFMLWHNAKLLRQCEALNRESAAWHEATKNVIRRAITDDNE